MAHILIGVVLFLMSLIGVGVAWKRFRARGWQGAGSITRIIIASAVGWVVVGVAMYVWSRLALP